MLVVCSTGVVPGGRHHRESDCIESRFLRAAPRRGSTPTGRPCARSWPAHRARAAPARSERPFDPPLRPSGDRPRSSGAAAASSRRWGTVIELVHPAIPVDVYSSHDVWGGLVSGLRSSHRRRAVRGRTATLSVEVSGPRSLDSVGGGSRRALIVPHHSYPRWAVRRRLAMAPHGAGRLGAVTTWGSLIAWFASTPSPPGGSPGRRLVVANAAPPPRPHRRRGREATGPAATRCRRVRAIPHRGQLRGGSIARRPRLPRAVLRRLHGADLGRPSFLMSSAHLR